MVTMQTWPPSRHNVPCRRENSFTVHWCGRDTEIFFGQLWQNGTFQLICFPPQQPWLEFKGIVSFIFQNWIGPHVLCNENSNRLRYCRCSVVRPRQLTLHNILNFWLSCTSTVFGTRWGFCRLWLQHFWLFINAVLLSRTGTILETCKANFTDTFRLVCCSFFSRKTIIFPHCGSKRSRRSAMFENMTMSTHMVCLIWKFSTGGRGATFLPSNMAQELQISVFDRLSMKNAHLIEIWILSLQYNDSLRALLERYAKNRTKIETWNQVIVNRTEWS